MFGFEKFIKKPPTAQQLKDQLLPFAGFPTGSVPSPFIEMLSDEELQELNLMLNWNTFVVDGKGRRFGLPASLQKRNSPQTIPDYRVALLDKFFGLKDKSVLEFGCLEGIHTVALAGLAKKVTAIDSRVENVVKTIVRLGFYNCSARVFVCDLENIKEQAKEFLSCDILFHVGVLYHLRDPVGHLHSLPEFVKEGIMLDTHVARPEEIQGEYNILGNNYKYKFYREGGKKEVFSGMYDHAKWLLLEDIENILKSVGFSKLTLVEKRNERNGLRVLLIAQRAS